MNIVCVDDEELILNLVVSMCKEYSAGNSVTGFTDSIKMLEFIETNHTDIVISDIDMPKLNGINLALKIKEKSPETAIIFLTGYSEFALDAFRLHASGYLLKPINKENLFAEITYATKTKEEKSFHIFVQTFGNFDIFVDKKVVAFSRSKAKEVLAYLVDKQGTSVTRAEIFSAIYEDNMYDRKQQKMLDVIIRSLKTTLKENNIGEIIEMKKGTIRVCPEKFDCDMYKLLKGDIDAINSYKGEYMSSYTWASITESFIDRNIKKQK